MQLAIIEKTLVRENQYSVSPNPSTPNRLIPKINARTLTDHTQSGTLGNQNCKINEIAEISIGNDIAQDSQ
jgi:hypothetical protein